MSAELRNEIAAAASLVDGVTVKPYYRQTAKPGDGWVSLQRLDRDDSGLGFMALWAVMVVLPQDLKAAEVWIDDHADAIAEALGHALVVSAVVPSSLTWGGNPVPGLVFEGYRAR